MGADNEGKPLQGFGVAPDNEGKPLQGFGVAPDNKGKPLQGFGVAPDNEGKPLQRFGFLGVCIINGPNLNLLGTREPGIYGSRTFEDYLVTLRELYHHVTITYMQSNVEGELINMLHSCIGKAQGVILNAGGYTHTSVAIADAVGAIGIPVIEVHISNVLAREDYRKTSFIAAKCIGSISGLGLNGYALAVQHFLDTI